MIDQYVNRECIFFFRTTRRYALKLANRLKPYLFGIHQYLEAHKGTQSFPSLGGSDCLTIFLYIKID